MPIVGIDHVQLAMPPGAEARARVFYAGLLGLAETPKPPKLAGRPGVWFENDCVRLHLGVEGGFRPAKKAHPGLCARGYFELVERLEAAGHRVAHAETLEGVRRCHVFDPFGNRIELIDADAMRAPSEASDATPLWRPEAVLFDLGDTLMRIEYWNPRAGTERLLELARNPRGVSADVVQERIRALHADLVARRESAWLELSPFTAQRLVYEAYGMTFELSLEALEREFYGAARRFRPEPGALELLTWLHQQGFYLGVVSNSQSSSRELAHELDAHGLLEPLKFVVSSADYTVRKPHPALFELAAGKLGILPQDVWYVGDMPDRDVAGARAAGMKAIWYNARGVPDGEPRPHAEVRDFAALRRLIESVSADPKSSVPPALR